jgi:phage-related holin
MNIFGIKKYLNALKSILCLVVIAMSTANDTHVATLSIKMTALLTPYIKTAGIAIKRVKIGIKNHTLFIKNGMLMPDNAASRMLTK